MVVGGPITAAWRTAVRVARSGDDYETLATASKFTPLGTTATVQQQFSWEHTYSTPLGTAGARRAGCSSA